MNSFEWHGIQVSNESVEYSTKNQKFYIKLSEVDGAVVDFIDYKLFLLFGVLSLLGAMSEDIRVSAILIGVVLIVLYFVTRKLVLRVHGGNIIIRRDINGKDLLEAEKFILNLKNTVNSTR